MTPHTFDDAMHAVTGHLGPDALGIAPEAITGADAAALIGALNAELSAQPTSAWTRSLGFTRLVLETGTRQTEALALYRTAGFTEIPANGEYAASSGTSICLAKTLRPFKRS